MSVSLFVTEALPEDVGLGVARIDPDVLSDEKIEVGKAIRIVGRRSTVAIALPFPKVFQGQKITKIDHTIRANAACWLNEWVTIEKAEARDARSIKLGIKTPGLFEGEMPADIAAAMRGRAIVAGDRVAIREALSRLELDVLDTEPGGPVIVQPDTTIVIEHAAPAEDREIGYEDVGGLDEQIQRLRELVEMPFRDSTAFQKLGIPCPKGVLLYGPPGSGKTLLVKAVANEAGAHLIRASGPDLMDQYYRGKDELLWSIFRAALQHPPSIIFLDDMDALFLGKRGKRGDIERRAIADLLAYLDRLEARGDVIVIGATSSPNAIDPELRSPGRFDREIPLGIPGKASRLQILRIHTSRLPLGSDVNLEGMAELTGGFVGADLAALCQEAATRALQRATSLSTEQGESSTDYAFADLQVQHDDFLQALRTIMPKAAREIYVEVPAITWEQIGGLEDVRETLTRAVEWPLKRSQLLARFSVKATKAILIYGPPGTGKTSIVKALGNASQVNLLFVSCPALLVGKAQAAQTLAEVFNKSKTAAPCIILLDEIDAFATVATPQSPWASETRGVLLGQLVSELDKLESLERVLVAATASSLDAVDPLLLRPGRFDLTVEVPLPDEKARASIFKIHLRGKPLAESVNVVQLSRRTEGLSGADIELICRTAAEMAIEEFLAVREPSTEEELWDCVIRMEHLERAIEFVQGSKKKVQLS